MESLYQRILPTVGVIILFFIFCFIQLQHINLDFWNDELYTLEKFVFVPLTTTFTDYHVPNNHLFFNVLNHIYLKIIGVDTLSDLLATPYKIRLLPFGYSLLIFMYVYLLGKKFFNKTIALIALVLLTTNIPFYNFALQIRGYGLSTLLLLLVVYYVLSYLSKTKQYYLFLISLFTTLLLYTIPSNLYAVISIPIFLSLYIVWKEKLFFHRNFSLKKIITNKACKPIIAISLGIIGVLILYSPIFKAVFMNPYVVAGEPFQFSKFRQYLPHFIRGIVSGQWLVIIFVVLGFLIAIKRSIRWVLPLGVFVFVSFLPFFFVFLRGDNPPFRIFVVAIPLLTLMLGTGLYAFAERISVKRNLGFCLILALLGYTLFTFQQERKKIAKTVSEDLHQVNYNRFQDLYTQYYAAYYQPLKDIKQFKQIYEKKPYPILLNKSGTYAYETINYLNQAAIPFLDIGELDTELAKQDSVYVLTNYVYLLMDKSEKYTIDFLSPKKALTYHNILIYSNK